MRLPVVPYLLLAAVLPTSMVAQGRSVATEGIIPYRDATRKGVLWVSAEAAENPGGMPDLTFIRGRVRKLFEPTREDEDEMAAAAATGRFVPPTPKPGTVVHRYHWTPEHPADCVSSFVPAETEARNASPTTSLQDMLGSSYAIVRGEIVQITGGFLDGYYPWSLLKVRIERTVKPPRAFAIGGELLVAHPHARFLFGGKSFCHDSPDFRHAPKVGEKVMLFVPTIPVDRDMRVVVVDRPEYLWYETLDGALVVNSRSTRWRQSFADTLGDVASLDDAEQLISMLDSTWIQPTEIPESQRSGKL